MPDTVNFTPYSLKELAKLIGLVALYVLLAKLMVLLFAGNDVVEFLWLATGVALVVVLVGGNKYLPAVFLGALLGYWLIGKPPTFSLVAALLHAASIFLGIWLLKREGRFDPALPTLGDYRRILVLALGIGLFTAAAMQMLAWLEPSFAGSQSFNQRWAGHALGIIVIMPLLLVWRQLPREWAAPRASVEAALILGLSFLVGQVVFLDWLHDSLGMVARGYWMFLFITWAAVRLELHGTVLILAVTAIQGLAGAWLGMGFFSNDIAKTQLANYSFYMLCLSVVGMALATYFTERKRAEAMLRQAASVFTSSQEGIMITDHENRIIDVNPAFTRITGYSRDEVIGRNPGILGSGRQVPEFYAEMWKSLAETGSWQGEIWNRCKSGEIYAEHLSIDTVRGEDGATKQYVAVFSDISRIKKHQSELDRIAHFDTLTGVPNRRLLGDRLGQAIARAKLSGKLLAVCYLDLDGFKPINDQYGHAAGDHLLVEITARLLNILHGDDTLARLGGDEFVLVFTGLAKPQEINEALDRILAAVSAPVSIEGTPACISASIGVTLYPADDADADTLLRHADQAMYRAKEAGKNRYHLFDPEHEREIKAHRSEVERLAEALKDGEFILHYQPKVDLVSGEVIGAEALIRWQHPERGLLAPGAFLHYLDGSDLESAVGEWVIESVLKQIEIWNAAGVHFPVSANINADHLLQPNFADRLRQILERHPTVNHGDLELEILETAALKDLEQAVIVLAYCKKLGVHFAIDDFGTGYSSLTYFQRLPVDILKIDQSFVRDMLTDPSDLGIVESVVRMAQAFNKSVIAEGVETLEHGAMLVQLGCRFAQGYGIARPMLAELLSRWLEDWRGEASWHSIDKRIRASEDLPLIVAAQSHRHWVDRVTELLEQPAEGPLFNLDSHHCRFGRWYRSSGTARYGALPAFRAIEPLHEFIHVLVVGLVALARDGHVEAARAQLPDLYAARDKLLVKIEALIQELALEKRVEDKITLVSN